MRIFLQNKETVIRNISDKTTECMTVFLYFYYVSNISSNVTYYLSLAATTPGSSFPSRNSKDAPPPVEM